MENGKKYKRTLLACYFAFITQAITANFAPLLFLTFSREFGVTLGQLAMIPTVFFLTQLAVDLLCALLSDRVDYRACSVASEIVCGVGLAGLAVLPGVMPSPFAGILLCTVLYAVGSGLIEVLASPIVEACPFENKEGMMSLLHSFYCWGSVGVILGSTLFFAIFGVESWKWLALLWALIPLVNTWNFATCPIEKLTEDGQGMTIPQLFKTKVFFLMILLMVCAGASELSMAQWASAFAENALHVSKTVGDLAGPCGFAVFMGISRVIYSRISEKTDLTGYMLGSGLLCLLCYLLAAFAKQPVFGLIGCTACGFSVGIMWPGSLSISSSVLPGAGTAMFALLALAGDLGGASGPALVGGMAQRMGENLQSGLLFGMVFPLGLVICVMLLRKWKQNKSVSEGDSSCQNS